MALRSIASLYVPRHGDYTSQIQIERFKTNAYLALYVTHMGPVAASTVRRVCVPIDERQARHAENIA
jgi:hypothetical protein